MSESANSEHLSIGEVLALVREDFPDVTISKIRFLESQGLIAPERTGSGFRKFYDSDIERLRWILRQQGDHFLPLKVIKKMLEDGADPSAAVQTQPTLWSSASTSDADDRGGPPNAGDTGAGSDGGDSSGQDAVSYEEPSGRDSRYRSPAHPAVVSSPQGRRSGEDEARSAASGSARSDADTGTAGSTDRASSSGAPGGHPASRGSSSGGTASSSTPSGGDETGDGTGRVPEDSADPTRGGANPPREGSKRPADQGSNRGSNRGQGQPKPGGARSDRNEPDRDPGRPHSPAGTQATSGQATAGQATAGQTPASQTPTGQTPAEEYVHRTLSTPADVVAALQEDPRPSKRRGANSRPGNDSSPSGQLPETMPEADDSMNPTSADDSGRMRTPLTRSELCELCDVPGELLDALEQFGFVSPTSLGGAHVYDEDAIAVTRLAARYAELGVEPRHLRMYKISAEREAGMIEQLVVPLLKQRNPTARQNAADRSEELTSMGAELHAMFLSHQLRRILGG